MFQQFTWQTFLVATLVLTLIWYVAITLIFYRRELLGLLGNRAVVPEERLPHRWEKGTDQLTDQAENAAPDLMGKSRLPDGVSRVSIEEISFSGATNEKQEQIGLVPDVLEELKGVFEILAKEDGSKRDFMALMKVVQEKFPKIVSNPNIGRINEFISGHAPFHLSPEELENLWD